MSSTVHSAEPATSARRAILMMAATSFLVPAAGVVTAPILSRALDPEGRGQLAAALAPASLMLAIATLGLPDALTFYLAKHRHLTRPALLRAGLATFTLGVVCVGLIWAFLPFLQAGDPGLGRLILLAAVLAIPGLVQGAFRGAATGLQMWNHAAVERVLSTGLRLVGLLLLWLGGQLTVLSALLVSAIGPLVAALVYLPLLWRTRNDPTPPAATGTADRDRTEFKPPAAAGTEFEPATATEAPGFGAIVRFGLEIWIGSVAVMALARSAALVMVPLSDERALGLYAVATTISDIPLVVALTVQGTLFGVNSADADVSRVTATSRLTLLVGGLGCLVIGATLPLWITPLFGAGFGAATVPSVLCLLSSLLSIPGLMAASGISAAGRPGLRSAGLAGALVINILALVLLVPAFGAVGAGLASIATDALMTAYMIIVGARVMGVARSEFVRIRGADVVRVWTESLRVARGLAARVTRRPQATGDGDHS